MSAGLICNNCKTVLEVNARGDDEFGERAAWLEIHGAGGRTWDACSRSCASELLVDGSDLALLVDAQLEVIADIVRTIREAREDEEQL